PLPPPSHPDQRTIVAQVAPPPRPEPGEDAAQPVELAPAAELEVAAHRSAASRARRTNPLSVATHTYDRSTATSRTADGRSSGTARVRNVVCGRSQNASPLVPPIHTPPASPASAVTRPSSARARCSVQRRVAGSRQANWSGVMTTSVSRTRARATIGARSAGWSTTSGGAITSVVPGTTRPSPSPDVPTQRLSRTATKLSTGCRNGPIGTTFSSVVTRNNPRAVPTQTPSGAGARASGLSSSNSLIREPAASILTTPRSHASQSDQIGRASCRERGATVAVRGILEQQVEETTCEY